MAESTDPRLDTDPRLNVVLATLQTGNGLGARAQAHRVLANLNGQPPRVDPFVRRAVVRDWHDVDSVTVDVDLGYGIWTHGERLRLRGVWGDELAADDGEQVRQGALALVPVGSVVIVQTFHERPDTFARYVARMWRADGIEVGPELVRLGWARAERDPSKPFGTPTV